VRRQWWAVSSSVVRVVNALNHGSHVRLAGEPWVAMMPPPFEPFLPLLYAYGTAYAQPADLRPLSMV